MRVLTASELLSVWERGLSQSPLARAEALLAAAWPGSTSDSLAGLTLGRRDARLLQLREAVFGPIMNALATCEACGENVEMEFSASDIRSGSGGEAHGPEAIDVIVEGHELTLRIPTGADLAVAAEARSLLAARQTLIQRLVLTAKRAGEPVAASGLSADLIAEAGRLLAAADPQADIRIDLTCPACGRNWQEEFGILSFFWSEIQGWAARILREVHELARAYHWREADILALSPWRRQAYLNMLSGAGD